MARKANRYNDEYVLAFASVPGGNVVLKMELPFSTPDDAVFFGVDVDAGGISAADVRGLYHGAQSDFTNEVSGNTQLITGGDWGLPPGGDIVDSRGIPANGGVQKIWIVKYFRGCRYLQITITCLANTTGRVLVRPM